MRTLGLTIGTCILAACLPFRVVATQRGAIPPKGRRPQTCAGTPSLTVIDTNGVRTAKLDALLAAQPLADGENITVQALGRAEALSSHLVQIRDRERPHVHAAHDLAVTLLRGHGRLFVAGAVHEMRCGDVAVVPRGTAHYFVNLDAHPAVAFVTFAPPYDGKDQVPVGQ
jgi:quercetin dioxygenase-like cupin family protein